MSQGSSGRGDYGAELFIIHSTYNLFGLRGWNLGNPSIDMEYQKDLMETKEKLSKLVETEKTKGMNITELVREGEPTDEILKTIKEKNIYLMVMPAHT